LLSKNKSMDKHRKDFTRLLVEKGLINEDELKSIQELHTSKGGSLSEILVKSGYVKEKDLVIFLSTYLSIPPIKVLSLRIPHEVIQVVPKATARKYTILPVGRIGNVLTVAVSDPLNVVVFEDLERITGCEINPVIASHSELEEAIEVYYKESVTTAIEEIIQDSESASIEIIKEEKKEVKDVDILRSIDEAPVIKLTNYIMRKAVEERASDILIEPLGDASRARYRIDGVLREADTFPKKMHDFVISRLKVIAGLDITEHRLPQDGRFKMKILGNDVDFRLSVLPSTLGEKAALRVLDKSSGLLDLSFLGFSDDFVKQVQADALSSFGMILACGPTGSGKTTTLYSILRYVYTPQKNIITVEDPIEYQLEGINQVNVNYEVDLTFASALRSILRQDPDIIMVGEIRDFDTVDIAIKAALTGHFVLSTLHTTTAPGAVTRLINMGVEPFLLSSTLIGVVAQRLVRKLCPRCKEKASLDAKIRERFKIKKDVKVYKPKGCKACSNQGYKGRIALGEYLHMDTNLKNMISESETEHAIKRYAREHGMRTLREDGILKVENGTTSLEEVLRVTAGDEDRI